MNDLPPSFRSGSGIARLLRRAAWGLTLAATAAAVPALSAAPAKTGGSPGDPIIELPKFEVTDSRLLPPPESWLFAEIPGFEILSNMSASNTKRFVNDFFLLQEAMNAIMPGLRASPVGVPTTLILTGRGDRFNQFMPADRGDDIYRTNTLFFHESERSVIVVDFALDELRLEDNTTIESDPYRSFYREFFRFVIRRNVNHKAPAWFEEGLVQLFASIDFQKKWISFAMVGDGFGGERTGDFNRMLHQRALMPMNEFFKDPPKQRTRFWEAQAYAFVHMCLYGRGQKYQRPFLQFVTRLGQEPVSEEMFKECFKMTYKQMGLEIRGYIDFTDHKYMQYKAKKGQGLPDPPPFALADAPDATVGRIKGEALRLGGHAAAARNSLIAPYVRGERDPRLLAALGLDERRSGNDERARKFLEAAAAGKVERARAYLELARLRLDEARAKPAGPNGQLNDKQTTAVLEPLFTARKQPPALPEVYSLIAETWSIAGVPMEPAHFAVIVQGVNLFPRDMDLLLKATLLAAKRGFNSEAKALAERGAKAAKDQNDQYRFRMMAAGFERDAGAGPTTGDPAKKVETSDAYIIKQP